MRTSLEFHSETNLRSYRQREPVRGARALDAWIRDRSAGQALLRYHLHDTNLRRIGSSVQEFDREMRRAVALIEAPWSSRGLPRPLPAQRAGLQVEAAQKGGVDLILTGLRLVGTALLADPVQLLLTTEALLNKAARLRVWFARGEKDILDRLTAREAMEAFDAIDDFIRRRSSNLPPELESGTPTELPDLEPAVEGTPVERKGRPQRRAWEPPAADTQRPDAEIIVEGERTRNPHDLALWIPDDGGTFNLVEVTQDWD